MKKTLSVLISSVLVLQSAPRNASAGEPAAPSRGKAFALSLLVPGAGEFYAGSRKPAAVFFGAECALWAIFAGFKGYSGSRLDDCRLYAGGHAAADPRGKGRDFLVAMENFMTLADYNEAKLKQRDLNAVYPEGGAYEWRWDSNASRRRFERMRISSDRADRAALFTAGGIALNHIVSGIDAVRAARKAGIAAAKRKAASSGVTDWRVSFSGLPDGGGVIGLSMRF
jgi:hypothetical protein